MSNDLDIEVWTDGLGDSIHLVDLDLAGSMRLIFRCQCEGYGAKATYTLGGEAVGGLAYALLDHMDPEDRARLIKAFAL
jgi:hypothetical protein